MTCSRLNAVQRAFAHRCDELLHVMLQQMRQEDTWDLYLAKGAGDRAIAGDHEQRHLLELLQNARDAIYRGRMEQGTVAGCVFVGVTERGMAMANTGDPFRLNKEEVLKAVRFLQRSDKVSRGFIGHKGVGLKSILLRAGGFSIRSRIDGQMLRATFSRSRTAEQLLQYLDECPESLSAGQAAYIRQQLPRLPLFTQPHPDSADGDELGEDAPLVEALLDEGRRRPMGLDGTGELTSLPPYTTVVYLPYHDERWEEQLKITEKRLAKKDERKVFRQARRQTGMVSDRANGEEAWEELIELDRRMLVLLGEIAELQFARFENGALRDVHRVDVEEPLSPLNGDGEHRPRRIRVKEQRWVSKDGAQAATERSFTVLSAPTDLGIADGESHGDQEPLEHIRILLETPNSDNPRFHSEPLFLYYPIETEESGLPFLIHGPFRVNSSRTALVKGQKDHNRAVLKEAVKLLEHQLPNLLDESSEIRCWLPWILLPLFDPETSGGAEDSKLRSELCGDLIALLKKKPSVPTTVGLDRPESVYFFPSRPDALLLLEDVPSTGGRDTRLRLLAPANRENYQLLYECLGERLSQAAARIGLGRINLRSFAEALVSYFGETSGPVPVDEGRAKEFFLNLCDLFGKAERSELAAEAANIMGQHGIPLLPAYAGDAQGLNDELLLIPAENRRLSGSEMPQRAGRVVFWRPASVESRFEDISAPPPSIPVYFVAPSIITAEGAKAEGILSTFYDEWGTTRFESRPDLFRRVADRAVELSGDTVLPVVGYLSNLLHRITSESHSGAEDLEPRPYGAVDLQTVRKAVHRYGSGSRRQYWERLESLQKWAQIQVPVQGERGFAPAEDVIFGRAWAGVLRAFVSGTGTDRGEDVLPEERWAEAIDKLVRFREEMGRDSDDLDRPELAPPDDDRWQDTWRHLRVHGPHERSIEESKAVFDLLLLLGVRIGPRVEWRWLDTRTTASGHDALTRSVSRDASRALFAGEGPNADDGDELQQMAQSETVRAYCEQIALKPYHTFFSGGHSSGCRRSLSRTGDGGSALAGWIWFPDLREAAPTSLPFEGVRSIIDEFRASLLAVWPSLSQRVLQTGWYCCRKWHRGRRWEKPIPSLAAFQLSRLKLWPARAEGHIPDIDKRRFPASIMVAWEAEESPSPNDAVRFFPLFDTREKLGASVAQDLQIDSLSEVSFHGAVSRLRWLLDESRADGQAPATCWPIHEFGEVSRNAWLTAQYRLLARIVDEDPHDLWSKRTALIGGLALRALRGDNQIAVPVVAGHSGDPRFPRNVNLAFFSQSPRYWERDEHADKWIFTTRSQLQTKLYRWAEALGAERIPPSRPPAYTGASVDTPEAVRALRREVRDRLALLLGVFKAHQAERLDEMARMVLDAISRLRAVKPDIVDEAGSSGLDGDGNIVFSYPAYEEAKEGTQAVVLAEGIALLVNQTTAVGDLQNALGAPPRQVELALHFRGVDLDDIVRNVSALARERLKSMKERIERLTQALSETTGSGAPTSFNSETDKSLARDWMTTIESLQATRGPIADQALDAIQVAAPDLDRAACKRLLRATVGDGLSANVTVRDLLSTLREADWCLEKRKVFAECDPVEGDFHLRDQRELADATLSVAITIALIEQLRTGELDGEDLILRLANLGSDLYGLLSYYPTDRDVDFIGHVEDQLKIPIALEPPGFLLIEWEETNWNQFKEDLLDTGYGLLPEVPEKLHGVLKTCLDQGSLMPLQEGHRQKLDERQRRIGDLERRLAERHLSFDPEALIVGPGPRVESSARTSRPGEKSGGSTGVTSDQAVRGRVAELFALQACWVRFLELDHDRRRQVLGQIASLRREGSGRGNDRVRWGTKTAWQDLRKRLERHREELVAADDTQASEGMAKLFKDLVEVANERGPGYDVLDPIAVWGAAGDDHNYGASRVEVKAILPGSEEQTSYRIVLTTNEFHRASRDPDSYVLRLISVPREPEQHLDQVRWLCDIHNPVRALRLQEQIGKGVRGGTLPLTLEIGPLDER